MFAFRPRVALRTSSIMSVAQQIHALLSQTVSPDTALIQQATSTLNTQYYKNPECIPALYEIIATGDDVAVRQLAAVELRKRFNYKDGKLWLAVRADIRNEIKRQILERIIVEDSSPVRHSTARAVSALACIELPLQTWPDLMPYLYNLSAAPTAVHREIGIFMLYSLLDTVAEEFSSEFGRLWEICGRGLVDAESGEVRITTLRALGKLAEYIEPTSKEDIRVFQSLIPQMVQVLSTSIQEEKEDEARYGFDVFETLLILETPLLSKSLADLISFFLSVGENTNVDADIRVMALNALLWTIRYKGKRVQSLGLGEMILGRLLPIGREEDADEGGEEDSPSRLAFRVLDVLSQSLPPTQIFPALHRHIQTDMSSTFAPARKAALMALGVTVEGCSEFIRPHVDQLWPIIDAGLQDAEQIVKKAACIALGCLCEWLPEECATRHEVLVPILFNLIADPATQKSACAALDSYLEILGDNIKNYLPLLMDRLLVLLETAPIPVRATVTGAIGSAAHASQTGFIPYFEPTISRMQHFLQLKNDGEETDLRGIATDTLGTIAEAVGKEHFRPYFDGLVKLAFEGLLLDNPRLRECSFIFFGTMAKVFEGEFAGYLPQVMAALIGSCEQSEKDDFIGETGDISETIKNAVEAFNASASSSKGSTSTAAIEDEGDDEDQYLDITDDADDLEKLFGGVNSAIAIEKEVAADTVGDIFAATKEAFLPYIEKCVPVLVEMLDHYYEGIRKAALGSLFQFINTFYELSSPADWVPGVACSVPLHANVIQLNSAIFPAIFEMWATEDDKTVVIQLCNELAEAMNKCGPALVKDYLDVIATNVTEILEQKSLCQQDPDQDDEDQPDADSSEYESALISNATDLVGALANILGADFAAPFGKFLPLIRKYYNPQRSGSDRSMAIGSLGEIITGLKGSVTQYVQPLFEFIYLGLSDEDVEVRSNSAFAAGVLIENMDADINTQDVMRLLTVLQPFFIVPEGAPAAAGAAKDNACGAVARMILKNSSAVPLDRVLPVLFGALPLKNDFIENYIIFKAIFHLFQSSNPEVLPVLMTQIDVLLAVFAWVLEPERKDQISEETHSELIALVRHLASLDGGSLRPRLDASGLSNVL